ncbi:MAG: MEDS domain-containing protein, partial [Jatrophihabitantaceae bacterium]
MIAALHDGSVVVVVATRAHRRRFEDAFLEAGIGLPSSTAAAVRFMDARASLRDLLVAESPDPLAFDRIIGAPVRDAASTGRPLLVFGEMVDLLWHSGLVTAAMELETLWNRLGDRTNFSLVCAYENAAAADGDPADAFAEICALHTAVLHGADGVSRSSSASSREFLATTSAPAAARSFATTTLRRWEQFDLVDDAV